MKSVSALIDTVSNINVIRKNISDKSVKQKPIVIPKPSLKTTGGQIVETVRKVKFRSLLTIPEAFVIKSLPFASL